MVLSGRAHAGSGCAVSHKYKFTYVHVLKSGGMTVKAFLKRALCGTTQMPCPKGRDVLEILDCAAALYQHADYFVFSFVRNPYSRLYSGYSMAMLYDKNENASLLPQVSFEDFVVKRETRSALSRVSETHYAPQSAFLFDRTHCPVFDFVGRLERFHEDLETVLSVIGSPELHHAFKMAHCNTSKAQPMGVVIFIPCKTSIPMKLSCAQRHGSTRETLDCLDTMQQLCVRK